MEPITNDDELRHRLQISEKENKKLREEFDAQRAKMKELFLQKEGECKKLNMEINTIKKELDDAKSQIVVAEYRTENTLQNTERKTQAEISSLQHLVHETIEEHEKTKKENLELREMLAQQQDSTSLAPVLSQVKKTIARKLGGDTSAQDNLEDSMRKAQEDAEVLRSLVVPLEEEIRALKEKLRATDEELQKHGKQPQIQSALVGMLHENQNLDNSMITAISNNTVQLIPSEKTCPIDNENNSNLNNTITSEVITACKMCHNFEEHLLQSQDSLRDERQKMINAEKSIERLKEELNREAALRHDLETQWQGKRDLHKGEVQTLTMQLKEAEKQFSQLQKQFHDSKKEINENLSRLTDERERIQLHLDKLQQDNDILSGKYIEHSQILQNKEINLPSTVDELQEILLSTHENLIEAKIGCEHAEQRMVTVQDESQLLREKIREQNRELNSRIQYLEENLKSHQIELQKSLNMKESFEKRDVEYKKTSSELREQVIELRAANDKLEKANLELRSKTSNLQQDLINTEAVQKDFVRLSQSLQMELEKIRAADTQIRWQDDEDVDMCVSCKTMFTVTRRKQHCRHCGTIYCEKCLTKAVPSGRSKKMARVCDVCHTLLVRNTAPYFSQAPPHSP